MQDKLREIMDWKRREMAPLVRTVPESELSELNASLPLPRPVVSALTCEDGRLAVLVGEALMRSEDPSALIAAFRAA